LVLPVSVDALRDRYVSSGDVMGARHFQTIWLLAKGHSVGEVAEMTSFGARWIEQLIARYNALGPESLGDLRRRNGSAARVLDPDVLAKLRVRLKEPPDDGGLWTSAKVAACIARELGLEKVAVQRGWEALKACEMSIQTPRPKNPKSAPPEEAAAFKKNLQDVVAEEAQKHPERPVEVFASDEHRLGLKPVTRRVWAPIGERPIAPGHHRLRYHYQLGDYIRTRGVGCNGSRPRKYGQTCPCNRGGSRLGFKAYEFFMGDSNKELRGLQTQPAKASMRWARREIYALKLCADRPDVTPAKVISIRPGLAEVVDKAVFVSLT